MQQKSEAELVYCRIDRAENGSPVKREIKKLVRVGILDNFSSNYYFERGREMRNSLRMVVNVYLTYDVIADDKRYSLKYVDYHGKRYAVENIMAHYLRGYKKDTMTRDLDLRLAL